MNAARFDNLRRWKCKNGHVLGMIERIPKGKGHITRLLVLRHAIDLTQSNLVEVDVVGSLEGTMLSIRCDVPGCGEVRHWEIGQDAYEHLMEVMNGSRR